MMYNDKHLYADAYQYALAYYIQNESNDPLINE